MINKRLKEQVNEFIYHGEQIPLSLGTIVVCFLCLLLLIVATFTQIDMSHIWLEHNELGQWTTTNVENAYVGQIPIVLFIAALLGPRFSFVVMIMYLLTGFFVWPVFALGGGIGYIKSGLFGYILGYIFAVIPVGQILYKNYNLKGIILATLIGVFSVHICGALYCIILAIFKAVSFPYAFSAISSLSGIKTVYDIVISFLLIILAIPVKKVLWIAMRNSSILKRQKKSAPVRKDIETI